MLLSSPYYLLLKYNTIQSVISKAHLRGTSRSADNCNVSRLYEIHVGLQSVYCYYCISLVAFCCQWLVYAGADPGGVQGVRTPALSIRMTFLKRTFSVCSYTVNTSTCHRECKKTHHFDITHTKNFLGRGHSPLPGPHAPWRLRRSTSGAPFGWIGHQSL